MHLIRISSKRFPFALRRKPGYCEQACSCSPTEAAAEMSGRNGNTHAYTSLPPCQAVKSHRPFNSGINDQHEHTPLNTYTDRGWSRAGSEVQGGKVPGQDKWGAGRRGRGNNKEPKQEEEIERLQKGCTVRYQGVWDTDKCQTVHSTGVCVANANSARLINKLLIWNAVFTNSFLMCCPFAFSGCWDLYVLQMQWETSLRVDV